MDWSSIEGGAGTPFSPTAGGGATSGGQGSNQASSLVRGCSQEKPPRAALRKSHHGHSPGPFSPAFPPLVFHLRFSLINLQPSPTPPSAASHGLLPTRQTRLTVAGEAEASRARILEFLQRHTAYELIPESSKVRARGEETRTASQPPAHVFLPCRCALSCSVFYYSEILVASLSFSCFCYSHLPS